MSDYTPTTEQVRRYWQYGANAWLAEHATDNDDGPDGSIGAEFDRWLAEHDRQVKAEAIRALADTDALQLRDGIGSPWMVAEWMNAEAERIEKGQTDEQ